MVNYAVHCTDVAMIWTQCGNMWKRIFEFWFPLSEVDSLFGIQNETCDEIIDTLNYCVGLLFDVLYLSIKKERK